MTPKQPGDLECPAISKALLEYLEALFPERSLRRGESFEDANWQGGERNVVLHLRTQFDLQNETKVSPSPRKKA
jgi:hypothetical protein